MNTKFQLVLAALTLAGSMSYGQKITFNEHIAPIVQEHCAKCHKENGAGPFPLISYKDVSKRGELINYVTETRYMPPWKSDNTYRAFANENTLSEKEITLIRTWVNNKMPKGQKIKKSKKSIESVHSGLGEPDLSLNIKNSFTIPDSNQDEFVLFTIPFELETSKNVKSIEFIAGNKKLVHHTNYGIFEVADNIEIFANDPPIMANQISRFADRYAQLTKNMVYYNGWIPGSSPINFPNGMGFKLPKRGVIILTTHYAPTPIEATDFSHINFHFQEEEIIREVKTVNIGSSGIGTISPPLIIEADKISNFIARVELVEPLSLLYVWPHMHLLGKSFKAYAATQIGDTIPLVKINEWDFNWQEAYKFKHLLHIPKGSVITIEGTYDNTTNNPYNPFNPPQLIRSEGLMETNNEMLNLILLFVDYKEGDENPRTDPKLP